MSDMGISLLQLTNGGPANRSPSLFQSFDPLLRILNAAGLRPFIQFARLRKITGDSACAPRLQHARVVSLGQHKGSSRAATLNSVFKQWASAANISLQKQCVCPSKQ